MKEYQKRLITERDELRGRVEKLRIFIASDDFNDNVLHAEQKRMRRQELIMELYSDVLAERIEFFAV